MAGLPVRPSLVRLIARRYRHILIASAATLCISATLLGLIGLIRWRGHQALQSDTHAVIAQAGEQLVRSLQSRRGTLTFIRDVLNRQSDLTAPQLQAMGASAVEHTRHLLLTGLVRSGRAPAWWSASQHLSDAELQEVNRAIARRVRLQGSWRVPSTFTLTAKSHTLLVMLEPMRSAAYRPGAIIGVFDVRQLLEDFFASGMPQRYPVQVLDAQTLLYRSKSWLPAAQESKPIVAEQPITLDAARWTLQMQPGRTRVVQTLSWLNILVIGLSLIAGIGMTMLVWLLAARTWILQRAVGRRTAALRRTSERLRQMAITDELTGLHNRRFFLNRWEWECERARRYQRPLACLMIDVNGFKQVNDRLGHAAGDLILKAVAAELKTALRQSDILARFGGDEFIVALPETTPEQAEAVAEKARRIAIRLPGAPKDALPPVRLSVGSAHLRRPDQAPGAVLESADQALYESKRRAKLVPAHSAS